MKTQIKKIAITCLSMLALLSSHAQYNYPASKEVPVADDYFGTKITDNYRWLEDIKNPEVQTWFKAQADYSNAMFNKLPGVDKLYNEMMALDKLKKEDFASMMQRGNRIFYIKTNAGEKVGKLYYRELPNGAEILLANPELYKAGKTFSVYSFIPSNDGKKVAIGYAMGGAEVGECRIMDVATKKLLPEIIAPVWGGASGWTQDNQSVFYTKLGSADNTSDEMLKNFKVKLHKVGTDTTTDRIIATREMYPQMNITPEKWLGINFSDDYKYVFFQIASTQNEILNYYAPAAEVNNATINWKPLLKLEDEITAFNVIGDKLFLLSHKNAPNYKITMTSIGKPDINNAKVIVPESKQVITYIDNSKNYLYYRLSNGITKSIYQINASTLEKKKIPMSEGNNSAGPLCPQNDNLFCFNIGWLMPTTIYDYDANTQKLALSKLFNSSVKYPGIENFLIKEIEIPSYDGTMVPLSIVYPKNIKMDGNTNCFISGYGGYGTSQTPFFWEPIFALLKQNVIMAIAHVRGGGEKGEDWHKGGMKQTKPNTWKDFIACAEYLVKQKYTSPKKMFGEGMSMGGVLIGNAIAERPDLFGAAIVEVGCTNMLRMELTPNGANQIPEVGTLNNAEDCKALITMDAQHKIEKGTNYPAVLVRTGMNDPRVISWMPAKFAATLQNNSASNKPVIFQVDFDNGHFTDDKEVIYRDFAQMFSFCLWQCGHPNFTYNNTSTTTNALANTIWQGTVSIPSPTVVNFEFTDRQLLMKSSDGKIVFESMEYSLENDIITLKKISGGSPCEIGSVGKSKFEIKNEKLYFTDVIKEDCDDRSQSLKNVGFVKLSK